MVVARVDVFFFRSKRQLAEGGVDQHEVLVLGVSHPGLCGGQFLRSGGVLAEGH